MPDRKNPSASLLVGLLILDEKEVTGVNELLKDPLLSPRNLSEEKISEILHQSNFRLILVNDSNTDEVLGMASLCWQKTLMYPGGIGRVEDVFTSKDSRGHGYSELMIKCAISTARILRLEKLEATCGSVRIEANSLYLNLGFHQNTNHKFPMEPTSTSTLSINRVLEK